VKALKVTSATSVQETELENVVNKVNFEREGHDPSTGRNYTAKGVINLPVDNINDSSFVPYISLTPSVIEGWIQDNIDSDQHRGLENKIQLQIDRANLDQAKDAEMANEYLPLPWEPAGEADSA
jgi:hypothetical protein